jgi:hypothetical protein
MESALAEFYFDFIQSFYYGFMPMLFSGLAVSL